ncbi:DAK2 domain-containing protein [Nocardia asteroides]|uniref:DAK2 domain-containing protein n=1 Tax=Nocardia asteroides TaxID=1824 RepID=UPI001E5A2640|nr:DAK2 domain-containing protein [Nocardia asteroides]UGT56910.1 DAK2 domain-containing protein [Nocardia asteroides]
MSHVREALDGAELLAWARTCRTDLELRRAEINALNVFPIADSDTGTNLLATMRAAVAAAESACDAGPAAGDAAARSGSDAALSAHEVAKALARGATTGARGNSGIILSQVMRGIAEAVGDGPLTGERLRTALRRAAVLVRTGLSSPVEGTILTVLDRAAVAAAESADPALAAVARSAAEGAARALNETPAQLGVLRAAGVVDAGARGLLVLLDCLVGQICGEAPTRDPYTRAGSGDRRAPGADDRPRQADGPHTPGTASAVPSTVVAAPGTTAGGAVPGTTADGVVAAGRPVAGEADIGGRPAADEAGTGGRLAADEADAAARLVASGTDAGGRVAAGETDIGGWPAMGGPDAAARLAVGAIDTAAQLAGGVDAVASRAADLWDEQDRSDDADPHFEVMYVISGTDEAAAGGLRDRLAVLGDSVVVVGDGDSTWSAHVHCRDAGAAIEAGLAIGTLTGIRIESFAVTAPHGGAHHDMASPSACDGDGAHGSVDGARHATYGEADGRPLGAAALAAPVPGAFAAETVSVGNAAQLPGNTGAHPADGGHADTNHLADRGILAVASGAAAASLFEDAGAVVLRGDRQLDTTALLTAIRAMPHREVLVLPNGALPAQELVAAGVAARDGSRDVLLLPSASMVQGLAALAVHDRGRIAVDDAFAMSEAAATTRWGALRAARVRALTMVGMCSPGDGLGLVGHDVVVIDPDVVGAGRILLDRMLGLGGELVTLLMGADAGPELGAVLAEHVTAGFPGVEVVVYSGGQQADLVQIGVE